MTAMPGTSFSVTWPMRLTPPSSTSATKIATQMPVIRQMSISLFAASSLNAMATDLTESAMELTCAMLPMPNAAMAPSTANTMPSHFHLGPRPFLM